jgi:dTDP-4-dehydrorhamnose reductase
MNIAIFGYSGFIGSHISKKLGKTNNIITLSARNINLSYSEEEIFKYFEEKLINVDVIINCCANTKPKNQNDIFINENLSKIIQNFIIKKKLNTHLYHLSSINVLIKERKDKYTLSKINAEKNLDTKFTSIIRLPLIVNYNYGKKGDIEIFYKYLNTKLLPIYPMIYPGNIFRPIEIEKLCIFFMSLVKSNKVSKVYNLMGIKKMSLWDIFNSIALSLNKKTFKINTLILRKILPHSIKNKIYEKSSFVGQSLSVDQSIISEKEIIYL